MNLKEKLTIGASLTALCLGIGCPAESYFISGKVTTKINDLQVKRYGNRDCYMVFTDAGVFQNRSAWYRGKWSSSDMQNELVKFKGKRVELRKYGWRIRPLHWYENVTAVREVPQ